MKIAMTCSVMDLFHEGHQRLLENMGKEADLVLVVLHDGFTTFKNKKKLPIENLEKRTRNLIDSGMVDIIKHTFEAEPHKTFEEIIERYKDFEITFYRGNDWLDFPGKATIEKHNIPIKYFQYSEGISSTLLRNEL